MNTSRRASKILRSVFALTAAFLVLGCNERPKSAEQPLRFGVIVSQTGPNAEYGLKVKRGIELARDAFEKGNPGKKIELKIEDSQSQVPPGLAAFQKLTDADGVRVVFANASFLVKALGPVADEKKVLMVGLGTTAPAMTKGYDYVMRHFPHAEITTKVVAEYAIQKYKSVAVAYLEDEYGKGAAASFNRSFTALGGKIAYESSFSQTTSDLRSLAAKIIDSKPDAVFIPAYGPAFLGVLRALKEQAPQLPILADINVANSSVLKAAGETAEGMIAPAFDLDAGITSTPEQSAFLQSYRAKFGEIPDMFVFTAYDAASIVFRAATEKGMDPKAIKQQIIAAGDMTLLSGVVSYDETGDTRTKVRLFEVRGSQLAPIRTQ
jgi:branched-chain amino acid transport system substrate-binding protein